jgi:hypothetical protein
MSKLNELTKKYDLILKKYEDEIYSLPTLGPRGGQNALHIPGWTRTGNSTVSRAWNLAGGPCLPFWTGMHPTPSTAVPEICLPELREAYEKTYKKEA